MTTEKPKASSMAAKLKGDGPITLTKAEAQELRDTIRTVLQRDSELLLRMAQLEATNQVNICMGEALQRQGFIMKSEPQPDGSVAWNLQNKPQPNEPTPITH